MGSAERSGRDGQEFFGRPEAYSVALNPSRVRMKNKSVLFLGIITFLLVGIVLYQQYRISKLVVATSVTQEQVNYFALQQKCADAAAKFFPQSIEKPSAISFYANYYNPEKEKCYIDVYQQVPNKANYEGYNYEETVWDVNTSDIYAMYNAGDSVGVCYVSSTKCSTLSEFHKLITAQYGVASGNNL